MGILNIGAVLVRYLRDHMNTHKMWAVKLYLVQFLYLINVFINIFLIDVFLRKIDFFFTVDLIGWLLYIGKMVVIS